VRRVISAATHTFVIECYVPGIDRAGAEAAGARAREAAQELLRDGTSIEYVSTVFVPRDEAVYHLFSAADEAAVHEVGVRGVLTPDRVVAIAIVGAGRHPRQRIRPTQPITNSSHSSHRRTKEEA